MSLPIAPDREATATPASELPGFDLLLSGGGYRATLFHLGVLRYLYEVYLNGTSEKEPALSHVRHVVGISGGSITAAHFASHSSGYCALFSSLAQKLIHFTTTNDIRRKVLIDNIKAADAFKPLFPEVNDLSFANLCQPPFLHILGTDYERGGCVEFSRHGIRRYKNGATEALLVEDGSIPLETVKLRYAIAASAAFPPILPPLTIDSDCFASSPLGIVLGPLASQQVMDGGVRDNLGIEFYFSAINRNERSKTCIISDAGRLFDWVSKDYGSQSVATWLGRLSRVVDVQMERSQALTLAAARSQGHVYFSLKDASQAPVNEDKNASPSHQSLTLSVAEKVAQTPTDLSAVTPAEAFALVRLGYDIALRTIPGKLDVRERTSLPEADQNFWHSLWHETKCESIASLDGCLLGDSKARVSGFIDLLKHMLLPIAETIKQVGSRRAFIMAFRFLLAVGLASFVVLLTYFVMVKTQTAKNATPGHAKGEAAPHSDELQKTIKTLKGESGENPKDREGIAPILDATRANRRNLFNVARDAGNAIELIDNSIAQAEGVSSQWNNEMRSEVTTLYYLKAELYENLFLYDNALASYKRSAEYAEGNYNDIKSVKPEEAGQKIAMQASVLQFADCKTAVAICSILAARGTRDRTLQNAVHSDLDAALKALLTVGPESRPLYLFELICLGFAVNGDIDDAWHMVESEKERLGAARSPGSLYRKANEHRATISSLESFVQVQRGKLAESATASEEANRHFGMTGLDQSGYVGYFYLLCAQREPERSTSQYNALIKARDRLRDGDNCDCCNYNMACTFAKLSELAAEGDPNKTILKARAKECLLYVITRCSTNEPAQLDTAAVAKEAFLASIIEDTEVQEALEKFNWDPKVLSESFVAGKVRHREILTMSFPIVELGRPSKGE